MVRGTDRPPSLFPVAAATACRSIPVAPDGTVVAAKYGEHADDQWSVDELLPRRGAAGCDDLVRLMATAGSAQVDRVQVAGGRLGGELAVGGYR